MNFLLDFLFPKKCVSCNRVGELFCKSCIQEITQSDLVCPMCERPSLGGNTHPVCKRRWGMEGLWFLGIYDRPIRQAIQQLKYRWITALAEVLVDLLLEYWARYQPYLLDEIKKDHGQNWIIVPVPLHKYRQNMRGFNQSALLGKLIAQKLSIPFEDLLIRVKNTKPQFSLKSEDRRHNMRGAFQVRKESAVINKKILLIDDVWTTGSTLKECSAILKRNKAKTVWGITIAR